MSAAPRPAIARSVLVAALITLVITGLRLLGEQEKWDPTWFGRESGGGLALVAIAWLAVSKGWDVHYAKLDPKAPPMSGNELAFALSMAQVGFWIPYTIMVGGFFGGLAAMRRK